MKTMQLRRRGLLHTICALILAVVFFASTQAVFADVLFYDRERDDTRQGVVYERILQMTERGMLDVHVLLVPLNDPYIYIGPVASETHGLRETATNLLSGAEAVAGINADFFGLAGLHSVHFGPMAIDGELLGLNPGTNQSRNEFASFFLDVDDNPFFGYLRADVRFYNNGVRNVDIASFNMVGHELNFPVIIDRQLMASTYQLSSRFEGLIKFVVEGGRVSQVTREVVNTPADGYVLVLPSRMYATHRHLINVGDQARLYVSNNLGIDFSRIQTAIGGGGMILSAGETVAGSGVAPNARHPRSAIGVTQDGNTLILMVADGRNHSIGATNNEMANLLRQFGAWNAMHFDGGGSSTMVLREADGSYAVANTPSDGAQRRIINALGVFDSRPFEPVVAPLPQLAELRAHPATIALYESGSQVQMRFSGIAETGDFVSNVPVSHVDFTVNPPGLGQVEDGVFTAAVGYGAGHIVATVQGINTYIPVTIGGSLRALNLLDATHGFIGYPAAYVIGSASRIGDNLHLFYNFVQSSVTQAAHMEIYPPIALPGNTIALNLRVQGNGVGHWLRGRVRDNAGRLHNIDFARSVDFEGWETVTATLPAAAPGPFVLDRIYMVTLGSEAASGYSVHFSGLEAMVAPAAPAVPQGPVFRDWLWAASGFAGVPAGNNFSFTFDSIFDSIEEAYYTHSEGPFAITAMSLYGGRLSNEQWAQMYGIATSGTDYVVILMDNNPLTAFNQSMELELFHRAMGALRDRGMTVFVVSATATNTSVTLRDGIRYINLSRYRDNIHFHTYGNEIWWSD